MRKLKAFLSFSWKTKWLLVESYFYLGWARLRKRKSFSKVAPSLGVQMEETAFTPEGIDKKVLTGISQAITMMSRYTFWESQCLVQAMAGMKMLEKRQIDSTLYLGTAKDENGNLIAHAWLRSGPYFITGSAGKDQFTVVSKFANRIEQTIEGEAYEK